MARPGIDVDGLVRLQRSLSKAARAFEDIDKDVGLPAAEKVADAAGGFVPRRTGALAGSIRPSGAPEGSIIRVDAPYAGVIHFGWPAHNISPQPFLYKAADARVGDVADLYAKEAQRIADDV